MCIRDRYVYVQYGVQDYVKQTGSFFLTSFSKEDGSTWKVLQYLHPQEKDKVATPKGYEILDLTEVDVLRLWVQKHRRIQNLLGMKAWSLTQAVA